jgi:hypothetical protein
MPNIRELHSNQSGFSLVDTLLGMFILGGGLLALALAFSQGMIIMSTSHSQEIAKQKASEAVESVTSARDTRVITWARIRNVGNGGVFLDGPQSLRNPGADGLVNTADDGALECETLPGPDGVLGTGDDVVFQLKDFTREIAITDLATNLRQILVSVTYKVGSLTRTYQLITYISSFA